MIVSPEIGSVKIPIAAGLRMNQRYSVANSVARMRTVSGGMIQHYVWERLITTISGDGGIPVGLAGLDYSQQMTVKSCVPRSLYSSGLSVAVPDNRRMDVPVVSFAILSSNGRAVGKTNVSVTNHVATITAVSGALYYNTWYWPEFTAVVSPPEEQVDRTGWSFNWSITAEEV
jgi:hypothetical protein